MSEDVRGYVNEALRLLGRKAPDASWDAAASAIRDAAKGLQTSAEELVRRALAKDPNAYGALVSALTVTETYFFRHPEHFELLKKVAAERRDAGNPFQTAWSVGCATGEEAYSLALTLLPYAPRIRVLASDVSPKALLLVRRGRYGGSSFRNSETPDTHLLRRRGEEFEVAPALRDRVVTHELNLAHDSVLPAATFAQHVDVIFCRNVLLYFAQPLVDKVVNQLATCLSEGGLLFLGTIEGPGTPPPGLQRVTDSGAAVFRRPERVEAAAAAPARKDAFLPSRPPPPSPQRLAQTAREDARRRADAGDLRGALLVLKPFTEDPDALALAATIHEELNEPRDAELAWRRLLLHDPNSVVAHLHLALVASQRGETREAERWRTGLSRLVEGRADAEEIDHSGMRVAYVRAVLATLRREARPP